jgi:hypothetical protein
MGLQTKNIMAVTKQRMSEHVSAAIEASLESGQSPAVTGVSTEVEEPALLGVVTQQRLVNTD